MSIDKTGGPAFPLSTVDGYSTDGMTLRDYFAGQMLVAMRLWSPNGIEMDHQARAHWAYAQADAMLAFREAQP